MKIVIRIADNSNTKSPERKRKERLKNAFLCGVASAYDWSGNAGKNFVNSQVNALMEAREGGRFYERY